MDTTTVSVREKRSGNRKDGYLVRESDVMHAFMPFLMPNRADNEAVLTMQADLTAVKEYLTKKNAENPEFKYTFFHVICAALAKTIVLRPNMNRFYAGNRLYDRKDIIFSFVVKKQFADDGAESLAILKVNRDGDVSPVEQIYTRVKDIVYSVRKEEQVDGTTDKMGILLHMPRPVLRFFMGMLRWLDYHGRYPDALMHDDPYFSTIFISNLGSIRMDANYHHLTNWGTNSIFVVIGEKRRIPFYGKDGSVSIREGLELSMTVDERIADGLYYANTIHLLKHLLYHPELLDLPIGTPVSDAEEGED